ncbi:MAG TPA: RnfABCDGE type electron transport complex subunit B [bacterium]|nr:RnfABCDGE type electron transport complex subunit B [bacterium]
MVIPVLILGALGIIFSAFLTYFNIRFKVEENPLVASIYELMPKANCGACGLAGCSAFAELLAEKKEAPEKCVMLSEENLSSICSILGIESRDRTREIARIKCFGGKNSKKKFEYATLRSCSAVVSIFGTNLECGFGCLGMGDCAEICPVNAISMGENGLPSVDAEKCTGCGKCVAACPMSIISLLPEDKKIYIACSSCDRGPAVIKACKSGCIGCGKCVRVCPQKAISLKNNLAVIDYEKCNNCGTCVENCPRKIIFEAGVKSEQLA